MSLTKQDLIYQKQEKRKVVRYVTKEKLAKVNPDNIKAYQQYLQSSIIKNPEVKQTTYKVYKSYMNQFMVYVMEYWDNFYLLDEEFIEDNMIDVLEGFMLFCTETLHNNKKIINTKLSAISSFYLFNVKRRRIKAHPFADRLDRMKGAGDEKIIAEHFLSRDETDKITHVLRKAIDDPKSDYDIQDFLLWNIAFQSACRSGGLMGLRISNMKLEELHFSEIREKRGKRVDIVFYPDTQEVIREFLKWREENGVDCDEFFVTYVDGEWGGMSTQAAYSRINKIGHILNIGDFRPHSIRKSALSQIADYSIEDAATLAGHDSIGTTAKHYVKPKANTDVISKIMEMERKFREEEARREKQ